mgnify:CR=1 FL=1
MSKWADFVVSGMKKGSGLANITHVQVHEDFGNEFGKPEIIDKKNILNATFIAMNSALEKLIIKPEFIIVDGNRFNNYIEIPFKCIVRGDQKYLNIAAASILAKTYRDKIDT